ncbi:hypothetical protein ACPYO6_15505 [Georgenia sp. Z1344]|uniref:hypothetical protein n=1 Tax=Georgenia sp. Z1344 TaxID=3416706 RepID=UPI003CFA88A4
MAQQHAAPPPGARRADGGVWNGRFWELPPGGPGGLSVDQLRDDARARSGRPIDPGRSTRSDLTTTTIASIVLTAVAAPAAVLIDADGPDDMAPGLIATLAAGAGVVVGGVVLLLQRFRVHERAWYVARSDARSMGPLTALGLDLAQALLGYAAPVGLAIGAAAAGERLLSLAGFASTMFVGLTLAVWGSRDPLRGDGFRRNLRHEWIHEVVDGFARRGRATRWTRFLLGVVLGSAAGAVAVVVPEPTPEAGMMVGILVVMAIAGWIFFGIHAWWDKVERKAFSTAPGGTRPEERAR